MECSDESLCRQVLASYAAGFGMPRPRGDALSLQRITTGFSGADVWRVVGAEQAWCLRRWPSPPPPQPRLRELHRWLQTLRMSRGIPVSPPLMNQHGTTITECASCVWQLEPWLPGAAEAALHPPKPRLEAALRQLALLHRCSERYAPTREGAEWFGVKWAPSPAVAERVQLLREWSAHRLEASARELARFESSPLRKLAGSIALLAVNLREFVHGELESAVMAPTVLFPCLRDVWRDHVLFTGDEVTGLIDASAARTESPAADLSRFLGSFVGDDSEAWAVGLDAYQAVRPLSATELRLIPVLDRSNVLLSALHWVERVQATDLPDPDGRIAARMALLAERLTRMASGRRSPRRPLEL